MPHNDVDTELPLETEDFETPAGRVARDERIETTALAKPTGATHDDFRTLEAGLDRLQTVESDRGNAFARFWGGVLPPVIFLVSLVAVWQLWTVIAQPRPDLYPGPFDVARALGDATARRSGPHR